MAEAQGGARAGQGDATVGLLDDLPQQVALGEGLRATVLGRGTVGEIPIHIILAPVDIEFIRVVEIVEVDLVAQFRVLGDGYVLEDVIVQALQVDAVVGVGSVVEERLHGTLGIDMLQAEGVVDVLRDLRHALLPQFGVAEVHVIHIVLTGVVGDAQFRIVGNEFLQGIFHGEDAADDNRTLRIDADVTLEDLWESLVHTTGNVPVLLGT